MSAEHDIAAPPLAEGEGIAYLRRNLEEALQTVSSLSATNAELRRDLHRYENAHAVLTAMAQQRWLPIESAPKDGTNVLLLNRKGNIAAGLWQQESWWLRGGSYPNAFFNDHHGPTHWQPLPPPPEEVKS